MERGYLGYDRAERIYLPTPEIFRMGAWLAGLGFDNYFNRGVIAKLLETLQVNSGETASVATCNDVFVHFHRVLHGDMPPKFVLAEGRTLPLTACSHGITLLSSQSEGEIDRVCRLIKAREARECRSLDLSTVKQRIREARQCESYYMRNEGRTGTSATSMLLPLNIGGRLVAVGIGGPSDRLERKLPKLQEILTEVVNKYRDQLVAVGRTSSAGAAGRAA